MAGTYRRSDPAAVDGFLRGHPGWRRETASRGGEAIGRTYSFASFPEAIAFVNRLADLAERQEHHPEIRIDYRKVAVLWWTHKTGGITDRDLDAAAATDPLAAPRAPAR